MADSPSASGFTDLNPLSRTAPCPLESSTGDRTDLLSASFTSTAEYVSGRPVARTNERDALDPFRDASVPSSAPHFHWIRSNQARRITFHPENAAEAVERVMAVRELASAGILHEEVKEIGVSPEWLKSCHAGKPYVAIAEQLMPLPTIFSKLDKYGRPGVFSGAVRQMEEIGRLLGHYSGQEVEIGLMASRHHLVSKDSMTSGFYFLLPSFNFPEQRDENGSMLRRVRIISKGQLEKSVNLAYREVEVPIASLRAISDELVKQKSEGDRRYSHLTRSHRQLVADVRGRSSAEPNEKDFNPSRTPLAQQRHLQERSLSRACRREELTARALEQFETIWADTVDKTVLNAPSTSSVSYCSLIEEFNTRFMQQVAPQMPYRNISAEKVDLLVTNGIEDWRLFLGAFMSSGMIEPQEPILRHRLENGKFEILTLKSLSTLEAFSAKSGRTYQIEALVDESRESVATVGYPTLLPIAIMRYWAMHVVGNGLILEDGVPYNELNRVHRASVSGAVTRQPRSLLIDHYTELSSDHPAGSSDLYERMRERHGTLEYLHDAALAKTRTSV